MAPAPPPTAKPFDYDLSEQRGHIRGLTHSTGCHSFHGIPYALPPVGPYRWAKPRALPPCYRYGTRVNPGVFTGGAGVCPQPALKGPPRVDDWDEDCLQLNVWMPAGEPPPQGWPVLFFLHGGFLQFGSPNRLHCRDLLDEAALGCLVVCPAYRLNVFGFLAGREFAGENGGGGGGDAAAGNWGFWDQRLALEWTWKNASYFGGDPSNITVGGYSAGAHSAFHQLAHDLHHPRNHIIRRVMMLSNSTTPPPKRVHQAKPQMDLLCARLGISANLPTAEKLARLRAVPAAQLIETTSDPQRFPLHEFKAVTDDAFISRDLFPSIDSGLFGQRLLARGIELLLGECAAEHHAYGTWRPPPRPATLSSLQRRLRADYSAGVTAALLARAYAPGGRLPDATPHVPRGSADWGDAFGAVYADVQVHALQRGLAAGLGRGGAAGLVRRYRIEWRAAGSEAFAPAAWGATHTADLPIWFFGMGRGLAERDKDVVRRFCAPVWRWLRGEIRWAQDPAEWEARGVDQVRRLRSDGAVDVWADEDWERGCRVWDIVMEATREELRQVERPQKL